MRRTRLLCPRQAANDFDIRTVPENPVFFQDLGGAAGKGYYRNEAEGVGLYFRQGRVPQITLLPKKTQESNEKMRRERK